MKTPTDKTIASPPPGHADRVKQIARRLPPAQPGARKGPGDTQSDYSVTSKIERLPSEATPAPLPPSPAAAEAEGWFEQVPTNPAGAPDLAALIGSRPDLAAALREQTGAHRRAEEPQGGLDPWAPPSYSTAPTPRQLPLHRKPWVLPALIAATALTVGMVLGALLFGGSDGDGKPGIAVPADCPTDGAGDGDEAPDQPAKKSAKSGAKSSKKN